MSEQLKVLFKTKGGHKEGMGDVTSSLAIAEEFRNTGYKVAFILNANKNVIGLVSQADFEYHIAESMTELTNCMEDKNIDIAILNQLVTPEEEALLFKKSSKMLVTIEDTGISAKLADLRFNVLYPVAEYITDFKYIPLAPIYQEKHKNDRQIKEKVENILVTQGGSDTYGFTPKIMKALYSITTDIDINVVIGPNFSNDNELNKALDNAPRKFKIISGRNDLSGIMLQADLAVSAGGNTLFELACLGVPSVVVCGEPFEAITAGRLEKEGFCINLGFDKDVDERKLHKTVNSLIDNAGRRQKMSTKGKELIDGRGVKRTVMAITEHFSSIQNVCR